MNQKLLMISCSCLFHITAKTVHTEREISKYCKEKHFQWFEYKQCFDKKIQSDSVHPKKRNVY